MALPTIKQLRYFAALAEELHFGRAAERCFVSQSAFSTAIQELESVLDTQLVYRTNRKVTITPEGREVARQAMACVESLERLVESVGNTREPLTGKLRLGVIPTIAPFMLPKMLPQLRRKFPELELFLREAQTAVLYDDLMHGNLDVILLALPFDLPGAEVEHLFNDRFLLAYRDKTRKVDPDNYRFSKLEPQSVMLLEDGHCMRDHALDACKLRGTDKLNTFSASSLLSLVAMVDADLAISYLPELAANSPLLKHTRVQLKPLSERNYRTIGLAWHKGSSRAEEYKVLGQFIIDQHRK
jgi:LysR family hydrogen peroxide-inducible transcriptional activator